MHLHSFKAIYPHFDLISSTDSFFSSVSSDYPEYMRNGFFEYSHNKSIFLHKIKRKNTHHIGIVAGAALSDYIDGKIVKHENTLPFKEQRRMRLYMERKAMIKPVLLTYPSVPEIEKYLEDYANTREPKYLVEFPEEMCTHSFWKLSREESDALNAIFEEKVERCYIADGHHRLAISNKMNESGEDQRQNMDFDTILAEYISFDQLELHDYNRVVEAFQHILPLQFMALLSKYCNITPMESSYMPNKKQRMSMYLDRKWYKLKWRNWVLEENQHKEHLLDIDLFNEYILKQILGIGEIKVDERIIYVEGVNGPRHLKRVVNKNTYRVGFGIFPVSLDEMKTISDHGEILPPKSTWFEPRIKNGVIGKDLRIDLS